MWRAGGAARGMIADTRYLARLLGRDGLAALVDGWGGLSLRAPKSTGSGLDWIQAIGPEAEAALVAECGGDDFYVPKCDGVFRARRDAEIIAAYTAGVRPADLARKHGLSERWIWTILGRSAPEVGQGELF